MPQLIDINTVRQSTKEASNTVSPHSILEKVISAKNREYRLTQREPITAQDFLNELLPLIAEIHKDAPDSVKKTIGAFFQKYNVSQDERTVLVENFKPLLEKIEAFADIIVPLLELPETSIEQKVELSAFNQELTLFLLESQYDDNSASQARLFMRLLEIMLSKSDIAKRQTEEFLTGVRAQAATIQPLLEAGFAVLVPETIEEIKDWDVLGSADFVVIDELGKILLIDVVSQAKFPGVGTQDTSPREEDMKKEAIRQNAQRSHRGQSPKPVPAPRNQTHYVEQHKKIIKSIKIHALRNGTHSAKYRHHLQNALNRINQVQKRLFTWKVFTVPNSERLLSPNGYFPVRADRENVVQYVKKELQDLNP